MDPGTRGRIPPGTDPGTWGRILGCKENDRGNPRLSFFNTKFLVPELEFQGGLTPLQEPRGLLRSLRDLFGGPDRLRDRAGSPAFFLVLA